MLPLLPFFLACLLSAHGLRKKSLSPSGAFTAFLVGFLTLEGAIYVFGVTLIGFYLMGSYATKCEYFATSRFLYSRSFNKRDYWFFTYLDGKTRKARLEDGYHEAGYRSGWQVLSNSASALVTACLWNAAFAPNSIQARILNWLGVDIISILGINHLETYSPESWCLLSRSINEGWSRILIFASLGWVRFSLYALTCPTSNHRHQERHFGCCLGDTLASELGILSKHKPILITTLKPVPPGTNGAISLIGTIASIIGGSLVGLLTGITLILENAQCRREAAGYLLFETVAWGMFAGLFGSLVDSLLGATVQQSRYSKTKKFVLQDDRKDVDVEVISGRNFLTNNQVIFFFSGFNRI